MPQLKLILTNKDTKGPMKYYPVTVSGETKISDTNGVIIYDLPAGKVHIKGRSPVFAPIDEDVTVPGTYQISKGRGIFGGRQIV